MAMEPVPNLDDLLWLFEPDPADDSEGDWRKCYPYSSVMPHRELAHVAILREHTTRWL